MSIAGASQPSVGLLDIAVLVAENEQELAGFPARVEFNGQVLETHGGRFSLGGCASAWSYKGRYYGLRNCE